VYTLGPRDRGTNSPRPLLVQLAKVHVKNLLMENLYKLKHAEQKFKCKWLHLAPTAMGPRALHTLYTTAPLHFLYYAFSLTQRKLTQFYCRHSDTDTSSVNRHTLRLQTRKHRTMLKTKKCQTNHRKTAL